MNKNTDEDKHALVDGSFRIKTKVSNFVNSNQIGIKCNVRESDTIKITHIFTR